MSLTRSLLICGVVATALYIATDLAAALLFYPGYDYSAQQISELSALGAPSRPFWLLMSYPYALLLIAFAAGVWRAAAGDLGLRVVAALIAFFAVTGIVWVVAAPMHMRGTEFTDTDSLHIGFTIVAVLTMLVFMVLGALALGRSFRLYSGITIVAMLAAGAVVGTQIPAIAAGEPTPWMGLVERVSVYGPVIWIAVFATALNRRVVRPADTEMPAARPA